MAAFDSMKGGFFFRNTELHYPKCGRAHDGGLCLSVFLFLVQLSFTLLKCKPFANTPTQDQTANLEFSTPFLANVHTSSCDFFVVGRTVRPRQNFKFSLTPICPSHTLPHPIHTYLQPKPTRKEKEWPFSV